MSSGWRNRVDEYLKEGDVSSAISFLENLLRGGDSSEFDRNGALACLLTMCIHHSRHRIALQYSDILQNELGIRALPWPLTVAMIYFLCGCYLLGIPSSRKLITWLCRRISRKAVEGATNWDEIRALLFARYWNNIRTSPAYILLLLQKAETVQQKLLSITWLAYSAGFYGHTIIASWVMRKSIQDAVAVGLRGTAAEIYPFLGIAYQMGARPEQALHTYKQFEERFPDALPFHILLSLTNQLNLTTAERDLQSAERALDRCFAHSFALNESRHHIQIYGTKAALMAIEGRKEEALALLAKSCSAAESNHNNLDYLIFHRFAAIVTLELGLIDEAACHLQQARCFWNLYGRPLWYGQEIVRIETTLELRRNSSVVSRIRHTTRFMIHSVLSLNYSLIRKAIRLCSEFLFAASPTYWRTSNLLSFLSRYIQRESTHGDRSLLTTVSDRLTGVLLDASHRTNGVPPTLNDMIGQLQKAFHPDKVLIAASISELLENLRGEKIVNGCAVLDATGGRLRVPCINDSFFIGFQIPRTEEFREQIAIGIRLTHLDLQTEALVEAAFRIILTQYAFMKSIHASRERIIEDKNKLAVAAMARQVAHDIRSPLAALNVVLGVLPEVEEQTRLLIRSAVNRIQDIVNTLVQSTPTSSQYDNSADTSRTTEAYSLQLIPSLLDALVSEKRMQFRSRLNVRIDAKFEEASYGLFANIQPGEFKRVVSNLINNAVEAIEDGGNIGLEIEEIGDFIHVRVRDNGKGIPASILPTLMREGATFGKVGGSGLGLYHARQTALRWGGDISIESVEGVGTDVCLKIPKGGAPDWFIPKLALKQGSALVILDDDCSIHQIWRRRYEAIRGSKSGVDLIHLSTPADLETWHSTEGLSQKDSVYLVDYELIGHQTSGIDLVERLGLASRAVLVTSHFEEKAIIERCNQLGMKIVPKGCAGIVPIVVA